MVFLNVTHNCKKWATQATLKKNFPSSRHRLNIRKAMLVQIQMAILLLNLEVNINEHFRLANLLALQDHTCFYKLIKHNMPMYQHATSTLTPHITHCSVCNTWRMPMHWPMWHLLLSLQGKQVDLERCTASGWHGALFPHSSPYSAVLSTCSQSSIDIPPMFQLLLSRASTGSWMAL